VIAIVENTARPNEMNAVVRRVLERKIDMTADPVDKLRARMELSRFFGSAG